MKEVKKTGTAQTIIDGARAFDEKEGAYGF